MYLSYLCICEDYTLNSPLINNNQERNSKTSNHSIDKGNFYRGAPTTGFRTATLTDWDDDGIFVYLFN